MVKSNEGLSTNIKCLVRLKMIDVNSRNILVDNLMRTKLKPCGRHELSVEKLSRNAGYEVDVQVYYWNEYLGRDAKMDIVINNELAIECKYQAVGGTADEKLPFVYTECFKHWKKGIIVVDGPWWKEGGGLNIVTHCKKEAQKYGAEVLYLEEFKERLQNGF